MSRQKPWKNTSFGHLETRLFTIKNLQKMQVLGGFGSFLDVKLDKNSPRIRYLKDIISL